VLPFPVELLRFLERVTPSQSTQTETSQTETIQPQPSRSIDPPTDPLGGLRRGAPLPEVSTVHLPDQAPPRPVRDPPGFLPGQCG
jgi:hypothetical protein